MISVTDEYFSRRDPRDVHGFARKLLRVLQEGTVRPVGTHAEVQIDVRVIAATNRNLAREVSARRFRKDLFYRIAVLAINTPPLRDGRSA